MRLLFIPTFLAGDIAALQRETLTLAIPYVVVFVD